MFAWRDNFISSVSSVPATDPYWTSVSLLMNFETPSTIMLDSSSNNFYPVITGTPLPSANSPFSTYASGSINFNNNGSYLTYTANAAFNLGNGNFTWEAWIYMNSVASTNPVAAWGTGSYADFRITSTGINFEGAPSSSLTANFPSTITTNTWYHVALVRSSTTTVTAYLNGVAGTPITSLTSSNTYGDSTSTFSISYKSDPLYFNGFISNYRLVKGTAVYNSNFTPSTTPLTNINGTSLLLNNIGLGQTNGVATFNDVGPYTQTITNAVGTPVYSSATPFSNQYPGSVYLNGSSYLTSPDSDNYYFTGDFTIEFWFYSTTTSGDRNVINQWPGVSATNCAWSATISTGNRLRFVYGIGSTNAVILGTTQTFVNNQWNHVAYSRQGTTLRMFLNGQVDATTGTLSGALNNSTSGLFIGHEGGGGSDCTGYVSNIRILKGTALYTTNFTVPTTPLNPIANTVFLPRFEESAFYDLSTNNLPTVVSTSGALINTQIKKFGNQSSVYSATNYITIANSTNTTFGTGNFTIECWIYRNATGVAHSIICKGANTPTGWLLQVGTTNQLYWYNGSTALKTSTTTISSGVWTYVAISRSGTTGYMFINGTLEGTSFTDSSNYNQTNSLIIGANQGNTLGMNGYLDDIRITNGVCRYTSSFAAPTNAFPTTGP